MQTNDVVREIEECLRGEKAALDAFVAGYSPVIRAAVAAVFRSHGRPDAAEIDDAVQNVFVRLLSKDFRLLRTFDPVRASLPTWLTLVSRSAALDTLRRSHSSETSEKILSSVAEPATKSVADTPEIPLELLSPRQLLVLRLLFDEGMEVEEAAAFLQVDAQTVRSTKHKALERLRDYFNVKK